METIKDYFGTVVIGTLFLSMFLSFMATLSQNIHPVEVKVASYSQLIVDYDEQDIAADHELIPGKNVIETVKIQLCYEPIQEKINHPQKYFSIDLSTEIFFPPKSAAV